jgi:hypothetical protein
MTQITRDYNRILAKVWSEAPQDGIHNVWPQDAVKALKALFKREFPYRRWPYEIRFSSGNRYTWVREGTLAINCTKGWEHLVHDWSHWLNRMHGRKPHGEEHLRLERQCAQFVIGHGWVKTEAPPVPVQEKTDKVVEHYRRLLSNKAATEKRLFKHRAGLERAEKRLRTLDRDVRAYYKKYEKRLD